MFPLHYNVFPQETSCHRLSGRFPVSRELRHVGDIWRDGYMGGRVPDQPRARFCATLPLSWFLVAPVYDQFGVVDLGRRRIGCQPRNIRRTKRNHETRPQGLLMHHGFRIYRRGMVAGAKYGNTHTVRGRISAALVAIALVAVMMSGIASADLSEGLEEAFNSSDTSVMAWTWGVSTVSGGGGGPMPDVVLVETLESNGVVARVSVQTLILDSSQFGANCWFSGGKWIGSITIWGVGLSCNSAGGLGFCPTFAFVSGQNEQGTVGTGVGSGVGQGCIIIEP